MADLVLSLLDPIKDVCYRIKRHISYSCTYKTEVEELLREAEKLTDQKERLQLSVNDAVRNGEEIYEVVARWLTNCDKTIDEVRDLLYRKEAAAKKRFFLCLCPSLKVRHQLGKAAVQKASAIDQLRNEGKFDLVSYRPRRSQHVAQSVYHREALESRMSILNQVMDALKDPQMDIIGVHGVGGVGKTTLAKEVHRQAKVENMFDDVIVVVISQTPDTRRIQSEIAEVLGLNLVEEGVLVRANRLRERMKNERILIILDDIWGQLHLDEIGIPSGDDYKRCKLLLTTTIRSVLSAMGTQKIFTVPPLSQEEAFKLFAISLGHAVVPKFSAIANQIVQKCGGLPLLIIIVAKDLRNHDLIMWKDKLRQLSEFDDEMTHQKVSQTLMSSYWQLPGDEIKSFFMLCSLFGQSNIQIEHLLRYGVGLGLFKSIARVEDARNRAYRFIQDLKDHSLLLPDDTSEFVKMNDVVRCAALSTACRERHSFICPVSIRLRELPGKYCTMISLPYCDFQELTGPDSELTGFDCPKAELLLLLTENLSLRIPDSFFEGVKNLKVLNFTGTRFGSLPSSLDLLTNLRTLCLHRCQLEKVSIIGALKQLEVLSFADSCIVELPREIGQLTRLKVLDLNNCSKLKVLPANILSKLSMLEELYMGNSFTEWEAKGIKDQCNASLAELGGLKCLTTLELQVLDAEVVYEWDWSTGLQRYKIFIGDEWDWNGIYETSTTLKLKMMESSEKIFDGVKALLRKTRELYLDDESGIMSEVFDLDGGGFPQLKHLHLQNNHVIQHIISSMQSTSCQAFPILESLVVDKLMSLEKICHGQLEASSFSKLRILKVKNCNKLTNLFSISTSRCLVQLQEIEVFSCDKVEVIIFGDTDEDKVIEFKQLRSLTLENLPCLRRFCSTKKVPLGFQPRQASEIVPEGEHDTSFSLFNKMVSLPGLTSLVVRNCKYLNNLFTFSFFRSLSQLKELKISDCEFVEEIIRAQEFEEEEGNNIHFSKLVELHLKHLPNLNRFCEGFSVEFQSLKVLQIENCDALMTFVSSAPRTGVMVNTQAKVDPEMGYESLFNEMVGFPNVESMLLSGMRKLRNVWHHQLTTDSFCKLKSLDISHCDGLVTLFSSNVLGRFQRLENLALLSCGSLQCIYEIQGIDVMEINDDAIMFELRDLELCSLSSLKHIWNKDPLGLLTFQNMLSVHVSNCEVLKNVFPASIAKNLILLEQLHVQNCGVEEIVAKVDEKVELGPSFLSFCFRELTSLQLSHLKQISSFYPGAHISEWPNLEQLEVIGCCKATTFKLRISGYQEETDTERPIQQPLLLAEKVSLYLEQLTLESNDLIGMQMGGQLPIEKFSRLQVFKLHNLQDTSPHFLSNLLRRLKFSGKLTVYGGSVEVLFSHEGFAREDVEHIKTFALLKSLELSHVDNLKQIWKDDSQLVSNSQYLRTLKINHCHSLTYMVPISSSFQNLLSLDVSFCSRLEKLVTASTAKTMVQLTRMIIHSCKMMTVIVCNDGDQTEHDEIAFSKLKCIELDELPTLTSFCSGNQAMHFPSLEEVTVNGCCLLKTFFHGVLFTPKLKGIRLNSAYEELLEGDLNTTIAYPFRNKVGTSFVLSQFPERENWRLGKLPGGLFNNVIELKVDDCYLSSEAISSRQLQDMKKLERLEVTGCDSAQVVFDLEGLFPNEEHLGLLSKLSTLSLSHLPMLNHMWNKNPLGILDFTSLKVLNVQHCCKLKHAFTWSMVTCLVKLEEMEIKYCNMMEAIIIDEEAEATTAKDIIFPSLKSIVLECLPKLSSFYSGSGNLKCRSLKKISIFDCSNLVIFRFGVLNTTKLDCVRMTCYGKDSHWDGDLITTIQRLYAETVAPYFLLSQPKKNWQHDGLPGLLFGNVEALIVDYYACSLIAISSKLLQYLSKLERLEVKDCDSVQVVFDLEGLFANGEHLVLLPKLSTLYLCNLPMLTNIWNKNPQGILDFMNLKFLHVQNCSNLKHLFTRSIVMCLVQLEEMKIQNCNMMEAIIIDEQAEAAVASDLIFPSLKSLVLEHLPKLSSFYSGSSNFRCPAWEDARVFDCPNIKQETEDVKKEQWLGEEEVDFRLAPCRYPPGSDTPHKMFPSVEELSLDSNSALDILQSEFTSDFFSEVKVIKLRFFLYESQVSVFHLLGRFHYLEELWVSDSSLKELFQFEGHEDADKCLQIRALKIDSLHDLNHIWTLKFQQRSLIFQFLETMDVVDCPNLISLAPSSASFPNLVTVEVCKCNGLTNLVTSSVAKSMVQLVTLSLSSCKVLTKVVSGDQGETSNEIVFSKLKTLKLIDLCNLTSFCSSESCSFEFPSLEHMVVEDCPNLQFFCSRFLSTQPTPKLNRVRLTNYGRDSYWDDDLNTTIQQLYMKMARCRCTQIVNPLNYHLI